MTYQPGPYQAYPETPEPRLKRRRWPWIAGIIAAFVIGGAAGAVGETEPEVVTETEIVTEEVEVEPADVGERRSALDEREEELDEREGQLETREGDLDDREEELDALETSLEEEEEEPSDSSAPSTTIPGSGTFIVGEDIQPGTYRTEGGTGLCYWARLSGLSGEFHDIITNGLPEGPGYVTIAASDVAFETSSCGQWVMQ